MTGRTGTRAEWAASGECETGWRCRVGPADQLQLRGPRRPPAHTRPPTPSCPAHRRFTGGADTEVGSSSDGGGGDRAASSAAASGAEGEGAEASGGTLVPSSPEGRYREILAVPLPRRPLFPGGLMPVNITSNKLIKELVELKRQRCAALGTLCWSGHAVLRPPLRPCAAAGWPCCAAGSLRPGAGAGRAWVLRLATWLAYPSSPGGCAPRRVQPYVGAFLRMTPEGSSPDAGQLGDHQLPIPFADDLLGALRALCVLCVKHGHGGLLREMIL